MEGRMITWLVFLGLGSCVSAGVVVTSNWKPEVGFLGFPLGFRPALPDVCMDSSHQGFSYNPDDINGPENWRDIAPCCGGLKQSPVDIPLSSTFPACFGALLFSDPGVVRSMVVNTGNTLQSMDFEREMSMANVPRAPGSVYKLLQLHLHWGRRGVLASEHTINGKGSVAELHLVFYKSEYRTGSEAMKYSDGLAVVGVFLVDGFITYNGALKNLLKAAAEVRNPNTSTEVRFDPRELVPSNSPYVTYAGSLTTPPCSQNVRWIVMMKPIPVSFIDLVALRQMTVDGQETIAFYTNQRPVQPLNDRELQLNC